MTLLYNRQIQVEVAGLRITEPRISVELDRQIDITQDKGVCSIYNLSPQHEDRIYERGGPIAISAGYPETIALIFDGQVQRVRRVRENMARITRIDLGDHVHQRQVLGGVVAENHISYEGAVAVAEIAQDLADDIGLPLGPLDAIPEGATVNNWFWAGTAWLALQFLLQTVECRAYELDGIIRVNRRDLIQSDAPRITLSPQSGLIGAPTQTDEGAECTMFLNPAVQLGGRIDLESETLQGSWKVVALRHRADQWEGSFTTWCDLRELE